ncbi:MFS transporter [Actinomadura rugatobispora]|uniref:MFS transporter n=1 Tax=Actinomadura rugatobispora TaxID=1994 RepID=A0ABW1A0C2_9ACTN
MGGRLGRDFTRLWGAYTVSTAGTAVATDVFAMITVLVLAGSALQVSLLSALGGAVGALLALPLGPWIEFRRKRPVMIGADVLRCCALLSVPAAYLAGVLTYAHLAVVAALAAVCQIVFIGASGAHLKSLVPREHLTEANGRFESVLWTTMAVGPPAGGLMSSVFGPFITVTADAASFLLSALGVRSIRAPEPEPAEHAEGGAWWRGLGEGWRHIWSDAMLRPLFVNTVAVSALTIAMSPVLAVMMLREMGFSMFQYGLSLGIPCAAGVVGARLSRRVAARQGLPFVLLGGGIARVLWLPLLPFVGGGWAGLAAITAIHTGTVFFTSLFMPVFATARIERTPDHKLARVLTSWTISNNVARAGCTLAWGLLATLTTPRFALAAGAVLLLATCASLPSRATGTAR